MLKMNMSVSDIILQEDAIFSTVHYFYDITKLVRIRYC